MPRPRHLAGGMQREVRSSLPCQDGLSYSPHLAEPNFDICSLLRLPLALMFLVMIQSSTWTIVDDAIYDIVRLY